MQSIRSVLFDFDGVLCFDRFYTNDLLETHPETFQWIQKNIFEDRELVRTWMRGTISSGEMNEDIAKRTGIDVNTLKAAFQKSVESMKMDERLVELISAIRAQGIKVGLVTDNMDVFSAITKKKHSLERKFDTVLNSADYGFLKKEQNGQLLDIALEKLGEKDISKSLMIDNQQAVIDLYTQKGGNGYLYTDFDSFKTWAQNTLRVYKSGRSKKHPR